MGACVWILDKKRVLALPRAKLRGQGRRIHLGVASSSSLLLGLHAPTFALRGRARLGSHCHGVSTTNKNLWRVLKGIQSTSPSSQASRFPASLPAISGAGSYTCLPSKRRGFSRHSHESVSRGHIHDPGIKNDLCVAGPLTCFTWIAGLGIHLISVNLVHYQTNGQWEHMARVLAELQILSSLALLEHV